MSTASFDKTVRLRSATQARFGWDSLRVTIFAVELSIVAFVSTGWLASTRIGLLFYLVVLPTIALQWLFNAGASVLSNAENLVRVGRWHDARNTFEGHLFQRILGASGLAVGNAPINAFVCTAMLVLWIDALYRMILISTIP